MWHKIKRKDEDKENLKYEEDKSNLHKKDCVFSVNRQGHLNRMGSGQKEGKVLGYIYFRECETRERQRWVKRQWSQHKVKTRINGEAPRMEKMGSFTRDHSS